MAVNVVYPIYAEIANICRQILVRPERILNTLFYVFGDAHNYIALYQ